MGRTTAIAAIALALVLGAVAARAEDKPQRRTGPWIEADLAVQLHFDWTVGSDDPGNRIRQLYFEHSELEIGVHATDWLTLRLHPVAEPVRRPLPGRDAWFRGFAMYMEELYVELDFDTVAFRAGKFNPSFAILHDEKVLRGIGAVNFTQNYEITEMLGFGVAIRPDLTSHGLGKHELSAQFFFADTTFLNHSLFNTPGATDTGVIRLGDRRFGDGGVGNTNRPDNVVLALSGGDFDFLPDLTYRLGFRLLRASPAGLAAGTETRDEIGYSAALQYSFATTLWGNAATFSPLAEWVHLRNPNGNPGITNYVTLGLGVGSAPWEFWLSGTLRDTVAVPGVADARDRLIAVSLDREVTDWLKAGIGYRYQRVNGVNDHIIGLRLWVNHHMEIALR
jgi:opacity protein-like surface antigen